MAQTRVHTKLPVEDFHFSAFSYQKVEIFHFQPQKKTSNFNRQFRDEESLLNLARMAYHHGEEIAFRSTKTEM
jgi:hypothetical protein